MSGLMMQSLEMKIKTETRRKSGLDEINHSPNCWRFFAYGEDDELGRKVAIFRHHGSNQDFPIVCPYGSRGSILYTRENFTTEKLFPLAPLDSPNFKEVYPVYKADKLDHVAKLIKWTPSIHQPKEFARYDLDVTQITVERLRDITEASAIKEGILPPVDSWYYHYIKKKYFLTTAVQSFMSLIALIHGREIVDQNPWLWRIAFNPNKILPCQ